MTDDAVVEPLVRFGDARKLPIGDESIHCVVTSPPYGVGISYDEYLDVAPTNGLYQDLIDQSTREIARVLVPGGRAWINIMPSVPLADSAVRFPLHEAWGQALRDAGLTYRDTVIWIQDAYDGGCGWGSWRKPSAPNLRGAYEVILCYFKPPYRRETPPAWKGWSDDSDESSGSWQDLTRNVWSMRPARLPVELPERCIRLSTWPGEVVLDPFAGSGTTVEAARRLDRVGLGFDIDALH
jgi:modification methylase